MHYVNYFLYYIHEVKYYKSESAILHTQSIFYQIDHLQVYKQPLKLVAYHMEQLIPISKENKTDHFIVLIRLRIV